MAYPYKNYIFLIGGFIILFLNINQSEAIIDSVTPFLSGSWFPKAGPAEASIFGLIILKLLVLVATGIFPYNLNEMLEYKNPQYGHGISQNYHDSNTPDFYKSSTRKDLKGKSKRETSGYYSKALLLKEIDVVERILLALRRIDSHDCFLKKVCEMNQNILSGKGTSEEEAMLKVFSIKPKSEIKKSKGKFTIWDIYHDALSAKNLNCSKKYKLCPLTKKDTSRASILKGLL